MSVLACDRTGCENVMCNRLSDVYGYLCDDCFKELISGGVLDHFRVKFFMDSNPGRNDEAATTAYYDAVFPVALP